MSFVLLDVPVEVEGQVPGVEVVGEHRKGGQGGEGGQGQGHGGGEWLVEVSLLGMFRLNCPNSYNRKISTKAGDKDRPKHGHKS